MVVGVAEGGFREAERGLIFKDRTQLSQGPRTYRYAARWGGGGFLP